MLSNSVYSSLICPKLRRSGREVTNTECARIYGDVARARFFLRDIVSSCYSKWCRATILAVATGSFWPKADARVVNC